MKGFLWLGSAMLAAVSFAQAQSQKTTAILLTLPTCAQACLVTAVANSKCSPADTACVCGNEPLQDHMTDCILQNCTVRQGLLAKNVTETMCGTPIRDKSQVGVLTVTILGTISATLSGIRIIFKIWSGLGVSGDDWWIAAGLLVGIPSTVLEIYGVSANGLGHDIWTVPFDDITRFGMYFYILELLYFVQVTLLKMSLLYFFLRIFPSLPVRRVLWGTVIFNSLYCLAFTLAAVFQCVPIDFFWTRWDNEHQGICLDSNAIVWSNAAISIAMDIWMLAIPLSQLYRLNQKWKKKVGVGLMFCVGAFVTVMSILRLQSLVAFANSANPTWDQVGISLWSTIEINVGVICACMPTIRLILIRLVPRLSDSSQNGYYSNTSNNGRLALRSRNRTGPEPGAATTVSSQLGSIHYQKSYSVRFNESETDQQSLMPLHDLNLKKPMAAR